MTETMGGGDVIFDCNALLISVYLKLTPPFLTIAQVPSSKWSTEDSDTIHFPQLSAYLAKFQNPSEADSLTKLQSELDETKIIMHDNIEKILDRGEKIDDLVAKSEGLSYQSKAFYTTARKTNSCCVIL